MVLRHSQYGYFYGCSKYPECKGTHGAYANGTPKGIPGDKETRLARMAAHDAFDALWKTYGMSRNESYRFLQRTMDMTPEEAHIGRFTKEQCAKLIALLEKRNG